MQNLTIRINKPVLYYNLSSIIKVSIKIVKIGIVIYDSVKFFLQLAYPHNINNINTISLHRNEA